MSDHSDTVNPVSATASQVVPPEAKGSQPATPKAVGLLATNEAEPKQNQHEATGILLSPA